MRGVRMSVVARRGETTRRRERCQGLVWTSFLSGVWQRYQGVIEMKLELARGLFLVGALSVTALAAAAWEEPGPQVVDASSCAEQPCPAVSARHSGLAAAEADGDNLLLLVFGLSHAMKAEQ